MMGATRRQLLWQVQLPLALPEIVLGLNQTIMMALAMVIVAALGRRAGPGLGRDGGPEPRRYRQRSGRRPLRGPHRHRHRSDAAGLGEVAQKGAWPCLTRLPISKPSASSARRPRTNGDRPMASSSKSRLATASSGLARATPCRIIAAAVIDARAINSLMTGLRELLHRHRRPSRRRMAPHARSGHAIWPRRRRRSCHGGDRYRACGILPESAPESRWRSCWAASSMTACAATEPIRWARPR